VRNPPTTSPVYRSFRRSAFTLVEILVVMGIIAVILSIALPVTFKARRQANRMKALRDLEALHIGLDEFKNVHGQYPQYGLGGTSTTPNNQGSIILYCALTGLNNAGNADPDPKSNRPRQAFINVEKFNVVKGAIQDSNNKAYLYFPGANPSPNINAITPPGYVMSYTTLPSTSLYNNKDGTALSLAHMQLILGDVNNNGYIDGTETPSCTAPYLLWGAGPDGAYGLDVSGKTDDVTNFTIPPQYAR
jgi:prepilin-type N-terminal cleavage/methylation domain-containing protein